MHEIMTWQSVAGLGLTADPLCSTPRSRVWSYASQNVNETHRFDERKQQDEEQQWLVEHWYTFPKSDTSKSLKQTDITILSFSKGVDAITHTIYIYMFLPRIYSFRLSQ